jgi:toxin ParE1/3/4
MAAGKWRVRLGEQADRDFMSILQWTAEKFGSRQADAYKNILTQSLRELGDGPDIQGARLRNDILQGVYTLHVARHGRRGRHLLLYRVAGERTIEIGRILHDSMDLRRHLSFPAEDTDV